MPREIHRIAPAPQRVPISPQTPENKPVSCHTPVTKPVDSDVVESTPRVTTSPTPVSPHAPALQAPVAKEERVAAEQAAQKAKTSGWLKRLVLEIFEFFGRLLLAPLNLILASVHLFRMIKDHKFDKKEWVRFFAEVAGALPGGGLISAATNLGMNLFEKDHHQLLTRPMEQESAIKTAGRRLMGGAKEVMGKTADAVAGTSSKISDSTPVRVLTPKPVTI